MIRLVLNNWVRLDKNLEIRVNCKQAEARCSFTRIGLYLHDLLTLWNMNTDPLRPHCGKVSYHAITNPWTCTICFTAPGKSVHIHRVLKLEEIHEPWNFILSFSQQRNKHCEAEQLTPRPPVALWDELKLGPQFHDT